MRQVGLGRGIGAALLAAGIVSGARAAEAPLRVFAASDLKALRVESDRGEIQVRRGVAPDVRVRVLNEKPDDCRITMEARGDRLYVKAEGRRGFFLNKRCPAGFEVEAPGRLALSAATGAADLDVSGIYGPLALDAGAGDVHVRDASGDVSVHVGAGNAELSWSRAPAAGDVRVEVGTGDVRLELPADAKLDAHLTSGIGKIHDEFADAPDASLRVKAVSGVGSVALSRRP